MSGEAGVERSDAVTSQAQFTQDVGYRSLVKLGCCTALVDHRPAVSRPLVVLFKLHSGYLDGSTRAVDSDADSFCTPRPLSTSVVVKLQRLGTWRCFLKEVLAPHIWYRFGG